MPIGTLINAGAIILGSLLGLMLGGRFSDRYRTLVYHSIGLCVLVIGLHMALSFTNILILVFSMLCGALCGQLIRLDDRLTAAGNALKRRLGSKDARFTDGFVTASLLFCIGSMAILGSIDEGIRGDRTILLTKSILDGFICIPLASTYGIGVLFSFLSILLYQGSITLLAGQAQGLFTEPIIAQLTSTGGLLIMGIGINLLELKTINVTNMLPSLVFAVLFTVFFSGWI
ncbi:DUF554 domain-containing protein [Desulfonatronum lacustre]|uniref:DUF554 domain-containing protein n=1 Tax=Desulfonatronum lacustre TaxID=66849 RepID=UPI00048E52D8|nr:DUF554 domain-containing protein [Desulfonatronum lacustre]SMP47263.1 hypothetical protein SAMN06295888_104130 [Desulfonatronum zhilinae]